MRISKVRRTDYRPPYAGVKSALEAGRLTRGGSVAGMTGLEHLARIQTAEAVEHDRAVADYPAWLLESAFEDLEARVVYDRKNPEHRWVMARRAALKRAAMRIKERGAA